MAQVRAAFIQEPRLGRCTSASILKSLTRLARTGLVPDGQHAALIPRGQECTDSVDYKGLIEIIRRNGFAKWVHADIVYENDDFLEDTGKVVHHRIDRRKPRGEPICAYAIVDDCNGVRHSDVMSIAEVEHTRNTYAGNNPAWRKSWPAMVKKTVLRRLIKFLPTTPELIQAINAIDEVDAPMLNGGSPAIPTKRFDKREAAEVLFGSPAEKAADLDDIPFDCPAEEVPVDAQPVEESAPPAQAPVEEPAPVQAPEAPGKTEPEGLSKKYAEGGAPTKKADYAHFIEQQAREAGIPNGALVRRALYELGHNPDLEDHLVDLTKDQLVKAAEGIDTVIETAERLRDQARE